MSPPRGSVETSGRPAEDSAAPEPRAQRKVCMLGSFAVGKTSLVRRAVEGRFAERYLTTVGVRIERLEVAVAGVRCACCCGTSPATTTSPACGRRTCAAPRATRWWSNAERRATLETAVALQERVRAIVGDVPFVLLVNKTDLPTHDLDETALHELREAGWDIHQVSARTGAGVDEAFADLAERMLGRAATPPAGAPAFRVEAAPGSDDGGLALDVLTSLDTLVLARGTSGDFRIIGRAPAWASEEYPEMATGGRLPEGGFGFLTSFLDEASALWAAGDATRRLSSGPFRQAGGSPMEATAMRVAGRPLLLLKRLGAEHAEQVAVLQRARGDMLAQDRLEVEVRRRTAEIRRRDEEIALRLVSAAESRDGDTGAHVRRIGLYSAAIARVLGWSEPMIDDLRMAAPMHDIGTLGIPDDILRAPGALTEEQWALMRTHTTIGARVLEGSDVPLLRTACQIALCHHEWWDGTGYPGGRAGTDIPEAARIVAVADVYDALVTTRPYRSALPEDEALAEMASERGTHFDPDIHDAFLHALPRIRDLSRAGGASDLAPVL